MNKQFFHLVFFLILLGGQALAQGNGKTYFLKFNMAKGQKFSYKTGVDMNIDQSIMGQDVHVNTRVGMNYQFAVVGDSAGWKKVEAVFDRMLMHVNANGQGIDMDTDSSGSVEGPMGSIMKAIRSFIGQKFYYTINEKGEVGQVSGIKEIADRMKASVSGLGAGADGFSQVFNEENFRQNMEAAYKYYPKKPVAIGESWSASMNTTNNGIPMITDGTYTLSSVSGNIATIKATGTLKTAEGATVQGMPMTMTGTFEGTTDFALNTGLPVNGTADMKTDMKMDVQGQSVPVKMNMKMNTVGKEL